MEINNLPRGMLIFICIILLSTPIFSEEESANYLMPTPLIGGVTSYDGQKIIADLGKGKYGVPLFYPDAFKKPR